MRIRTVGPVNGPRDALLALSALTEGVEPVCEWELKHGSVGVYAATTITEEGEDGTTVVPVTLKDIEDIPDGTYVMNPATGADLEERYDIDSLWALGFKLGDGWCTAMHKKAPTPETVGDALQYAWVPCRVAIPFIDEDLQEDPDAIFEGVMPGCSWEERWASLTFAIDRAGRFDDSWLSAAEMTCKAWKEATGVRLTVEEEKAPYDGAAFYVPRSTPHLVQDAARAREDCCFMADAQQVRWLLGGVPEDGASIKVGWSWLNGEQTDIRYQLFLDVKNAAIEQAEEAGDKEAVDSLRRLTPQEFLVTMGCASLCLAGARIVSAYDVAAWMPMMGQRPSTVTVEAVADILNANASGRNVGDYGPSSIWFDTTQIEEVWHHRMPPDPVTGNVMSGAQKRPLIPIVGYSPNGKLRNGERGELWELGGMPPLVMVSKELLQRCKSLPYSEMGKISRTGDFGTAIVATLAKEFLLKVNGMMTRGKCRYGAPFRLWLVDHMASDGSPDGLYRQLGIDQSDGRAKTRAQRNIEKALLKHPEVITIERHKSGRAHSIDYLNVTVKPVKPVEKGGK